MLTIGKKTKWLLAGTFLAIMEGKAQSISATEKKIVENIEKNKVASIEFLANSVNINSGTYNVKGVKKIGQLYKSFLESIGFNTRWVDFPDSMNRGGHLIATINGNAKGKRILLLGHMDTVFEPDSSAKNGGWQLINDSTAKGPGSFDMKGGNMIMLFALKALYESGQLKNQNIAVVIHGDEEEPGRPIAQSRKDLKEIAKDYDVALCFENGTGFNYGTIARRGFQGWFVNVTGKQAHSSTIFSEEVGAGAIFGQAHILERFYKELQEPNLTFSPGLLGGGTNVDIASTRTKLSASGKSNLVAAQAYFSGDLRYLSEEQRLRAVSKMKAIIEEPLPNTNAHITFLDASPAMMPTEGNKKILAVLNNVSMDLGDGPVSAYDPAKRGAGDLSYIADQLDCLDGLGALGHGAHAPEEYVDLKPFASLEKRSALLIYRLTNIKR